MSPAGACGGGPVCGWGGAVPPVPASAVPDAAPAAGAAINMSANAKQHAVGSRGNRSLRLFGAYEVS
jgi:hypothetical protein